MDSSYGEQYANLYRRHWWWRARERFLRRVLSRLVAPGSAGEVLDFGCGDGLFLDQLARYGAPQGIETDERLLSATGRWREKISSEQLQRDESQHGRYGLIVALDVLEHIADPVPVMDELARRLRPDGVFVATLPAFQQLWTAHDVLNKHVKRYTVRDATALVAGSGLQVTDARYFFTGLALLKWLVVQKERIVPADPKPPSVPLAPVNALLLGAACIEQAILGNSRPPFGSSVLIVGRRTRAKVNTNAPPSP
jgi:SAM-dependent methyltransferase